jgi:porin
VNSKLIRLEHGIWSLALLLSLSVLAPDARAASDGATADAGSDSLWTRKKLFGDVGGLRSGLAKHGVSLDVSLSQYFQGVADGGRDNDYAFGSIVDSVVNVNGEKLGLWKGLFLNARVQTQIGNFDSVAGDPGALALANTQLMWPLPGDARTELTGWTVAQFLTKEWMVYGGKLNAIDLQTSFFPHLNFAKGGFQNLSLLAPSLPWLRFVQLSQMGGGVQKMEARGVKYGAVFWDPQNSSTTSGFDNFFEDVAGLAFYRFYFDAGGLPGHVTLAAGGSTKAYTEIEPAEWTLPGLRGGGPVTVPGIRPDKDTGAFALTAYYQQILWQPDPKGSRNIRLYSGIAAGPDNPGISNFSVFATLEASGYFPSRPKDKIGVGGYYSSLADALTDTAQSLRNPLDDHISGLEVYYNAEVTPWLHFVGDVQIIDSATKGLDTSIVPSVRMLVEF